VTAVVLARSGATPAVDTINNEPYSVQEIQMSCLGFLGSVAVIHEWSGNFDLLHKEQNTDSKLSPIIKALINHKALPTKHSTKTTQDLHS